MKKMVYRILFPNKVLSAFFFCLGFGLLIYVFWFHLKETPLSYISYTLSTYSLILFCIWFYKACKYSIHYVKKKNKLYHLYQNHSKQITTVMLYVSGIMNLIYGLFKLITGIFYHSFWFITFAIYYLMLCFMKISLVRSVKNDSFRKQLKEEYQKLKTTGVVILLLNIVLDGMIILMIHENETVQYPGYLIYIMALYDFYLMIHAIVHMIKYRKNHSPVMIANKCINFTVAMISMISLEVAMIYEFGRNDSEFKLLMISWSGFAVILINVVMSIWMIVKANRWLKNIQKS